MKLNKLILVIGNGFDLAHGIPTSYQDFANWLLKDLSKSFLNTIVNNQEMSEFTEEMYNKFGNGKYIYNKHLHENDKLYPLFSHFQEKDLDKITAFLGKNFSLFYRIFNNKLMVDLFNTKETDWFAIENIYFQKLYRIAFHDSGNTELKIKTLNSELDFLRDKLCDYLKEITIIFSAPIIKFLKSAFSDYQELLIVNFNYTETFDQYNDQLALLNKKITCINIHGKLNESNIIFGYGNDQDQKYKEMKNLEIDYIFKHFKTVEYSLNSDYTDLLDQINSDSLFDVKILGHSLGLTDKTLLQEIFDHEKCRKIYLYKRTNIDLLKQKSIFKEKIIALSRILSSERDVRRKVNNFNETESFP